MIDLPLWKRAAAPCSYEISSDLPEVAHVRLVIFDITGREVVRLVDGTRAAGTHHMRWGAQNAPSGLYLCRISADSFTETKRMMLVK